jgi:hypothetical protein
MEDEEVIHVVHEPASAFVLLSPQRRPGFSNNKRHRK